ncbi:hypothetical protein CNMCM8927_001291 [Aspergillus lentulus]|uniref:Uncharacterized protein n=1 Tax=Aspergillus lentulus TaxID=293939 RepID=A0AAN5YJ42_ASPLE|nr:hypothetical protein CNMCM8927_001291 [Aspergillus lentulus]
MGEIQTTPPSRSLHGKTAIVTGAGCLGEGIGNGRAIAILLASDGYNVVCADRNLEWAERTVSMITSQSDAQTQTQSSSGSSYGSVIAVEADVTSAADCEATVQIALSKFGRLDILVNNVGVAGAAGTVVEVNMEDWAKSLQVNVSSMVLMAKYAIPAMKQNEGEIRGSIVNMGSTASVESDGEGRSSEYDEGDGGASCTGWHSGQLCLSGDAVHAYDVWWGHERGSARGSAEA